MEKHSALWTLDGKRPFRIALLAIALTGLEEWSDLRKSVNRVISKRTVSTVWTQKLFRTLCCSGIFFFFFSATGKRSKKHYDHNNCNFVFGPFCLKENLLAIYVVCLVITFPLFMECLCSTSPKKHFDITCTEDITKYTAGYFQSLRFNSAVCIVRRHQGYSISTDTEPVKVSWKSAKKN